MTGRQVQQFGDGDKPPKGIRGDANQKKLAFFPIQLSHAIHDHASFPILMRAATRQTNTALSFCRALMTPQQSARSASSAAETNFVRINIKVSFEKKKKTKNKPSFYSFFLSTEQSRSRCTTGTETAGKSRIAEVICAFASRKITEKFITESNEHLITDKASRGWDR